MIAGIHHLEKSGLGARRASPPTHLRSRADGVQVIPHAKETPKDASRLAEVASVRVSARVAHGVPEAECIMDRCAGEEEALHWGARAAIRRRRAFSSEWMEDPALPRAAPPGRPGISIRSTHGD